MLGWGWSPANCRPRPSIAAFCSHWSCFLRHISPSPKVRAATTKLAAVSWVVRRQPAELVNGAPVVIEVAPPVRLTALSGQWLGHEVRFSYDAAAKAWYGIAGVSLETRPGIYSLELKGTTARSAEVQFSQKISGPGGEISQYCGERRQAVHRTQQGTTGPHSAGQDRQARRISTH